MGNRCSIQQSEEINCWLEQSPEKSTVSTVPLFLGHPVYGSIQTWAPSFLQTCQVIEVISSFYSVCICVPKTYQLGTPSEISDPSPELLIIAQQVVILLSPTRRLDTSWTRTRSSWLVGTYWSRPRIRSGPPCRVHRKRRSNFETRDDGPLPLGLPLCGSD